MRYMRLLLTIAKANWQFEVAYFANMIFAVISTMMYVLSFILFISVLYQNVDSVAGYTKDEMLLLVFLSQLVFYTYQFWAADSATYMEQNVNNGKFDYVLTRPVSSLFMTTFQRVMPLRAIVNYLGPLTPAWLVVDWSNLNLYMSNLPYAIVIFLCGIALYHQSQFIMSLVSFWTGKGSQSSLVVYAAGSQQIPLEGLGPGLRLLLLGIIPVHFSAVVVSVMLGKSNPIFWSITAACLFIMFSILKRVSWRMALRQYSSASS